MSYRYYHVWLIGRIILLLVNVLLTGTAILMIGKRDLFFLPLILGTILVIQVIEFILYLNRTNREIARFISNISHQDLSERFEVKSAGSPFRKLYRSMNRVITQLEEIKLEKEAQYNYLQILLSHIKTSIISVREDNTIALVNDAARDLLGIEEGSSWKDMKSVHARLTTEIDRMKGRASKLIEVPIHQEPWQLSVNVSSVVILGSSYRIITLQDIRSEIEQKEIESWHKLIQILRHEIRNSVTPIASMTETIIMLVEDQAGKAKKPTALSEQDIEDVYSSLQTVHDRSERLYRFVEKYRSLTRIPPPRKETIVIGELLKSTRELFQHELDSRGIQMLVESAEDVLCIEADPSLVDQVLINLLKNSIEALEDKEDGKIILSAEETANHIILKVLDNGKGIPPSEIQDVFLPFFTTKEDGMGIGLPLSRQIMNLHGGTLSVDSQPGGMTVFSLVFMK
jgi:nitrogen fixation/metabolism regulation signal transduction histidine kinase